MIAGSWAFVAVEPRLIPQLLLDWWEDPEEALRAWWKREPESFARAVAEVRMAGVTTITKTTINSPEDLGL